MAFLLDTELNCIDVGSYTDGETSVQVSPTGRSVYMSCPSPLFLTLQFLSYLISDWGGCEG
jgi:hypothetical protein